MFLQFQQNKCLLSPKACVYYFNWFCNTSIIAKPDEDIKQPCFSLCLVWEVAIQLVTHHHVEDTYATAELENHKQKLYIGWLFW